MRGSFPVLDVKRWYSPPRNRFNGFLHTLHSSINTKCISNQCISNNLWLFSIKQSSYNTLSAGFSQENQNIGKHILPGTVAWGVLLLVLGVDGSLGGGSPPPSQGLKWFRETCSINEVPYLRKYHHSNIYKTTFLDKMCNSNFK